MNRPNILWYCTDQQRFDTIAALGNSHIRTPNIDRFMERGTTFTHAYCQSPVCTPSRASFLTGMYPSAVTVNGNGIPTFPAHYADRLITSRLAAAGYDCGLVGKLHIASAYGGQEQRVADGYRFFQYSHAPKGPDMPGHDYAEWFREQGLDPADHIARAVRKDEYRDGEHVANFGGLMPPNADRDNVPPHLHQSHWCTEMAIRFIRSNRRADQPWLLSVNPFDPHAPFDPPWEYYRHYDPDTMPGAHFRESDLAWQHRLVAAGVDFQTHPRHPDSFDHKTVQAAYYAMIEQLDNEFGRLIAFLDETGQFANTIVIFTSDHGEALGDHGLLLKGCRLYEGSMRVPLVISWPGNYQAGAVSDALVELVDLVPTLYDAAHMETPYFVQGRSLQGLLTGALTDHRRAVRAEAYDCIDYPDGTLATMYREGPHKLIVYHGKGLRELYDLNRDPWEHENLADDPAHQQTLIGMERAAFDAAVAAVPVQVPRVAPY